MCTGLMLRNEDGSVVHGRTIEFGVDIQSDVIFFPRGQEFTGTTPGGATGKAYQARFAFLGSDMDGNQQAADGLNEAGLAVGAFYFPDFAGYPAITDANRDMTGALAGA